MTCEKTGSYISRATAYKAAAAILRKAGPGDRVPLRPHWCKQHHAFHLTSRLRTGPKPAQRGRRDRSRR